MVFEAGTAQAHTLSDWPTSGTVTVFDTEFTAWEGSQARNWAEPWETTELVEIGAVRCDSATFAILDSFQVLVLPKRNPVLSDYFVTLTGITQADLEENGVPLPEAVAGFETFTETSDVILSNGGDADVFVESFACYGLPCPLNFRKFLNIQPALLALFPGRPSISSVEIPHLAGVDFVFKAHEALEDARAIATALAKLRVDGCI